MRLVPTAQAENIIWATVTSNKINNNTDYVFVYNF